MTNFFRLVAKGCKLVGCGSALPQRLISNDDLAQIVETSDEWISVRTGIRNRRILSGTIILGACAVFFPSFLFLAWQLVELWLFLYLSILCDIYLLISYDILSEMCLIIYL